MDDRQMEIPCKPYTRREYEESLEREFLEAKMSGKIDPNARLSINQAADFLGVTRRTIYNHANKGLLKIEHDGGKPFIRRGSVDGFLESKNAGVKKTQYVPDGHIVIKEEAWHQTRQVAEQMTMRVSSLSAQVENLLTYEKQVKEDAARISELEAENERLKKRGLWARIFNKGAK